MKLKHLKSLLLLSLTLLIISCGKSGDCVQDCDDEGNCRKECDPSICVDADDWGYPKVWVSAKTKEIDISDIAKQYTDESNISYDNYAVDSGRVLIDVNKIPLVMTIGSRDQWTSWWNGAMNPKSAGKSNKYGWDGGRVPSPYECQYSVYNDRPEDYRTKFNTDPIPPSGSNDPSPRILKFNKNLSEVPGSTKSADCPTYDEWKADPMKYPPDQYADCRVPCYMRYGMGLYVGLSPEGKEIYNESDLISTYHITDIKNPTVPFDPTKDQRTNAIDRGIDGYLVKGLPRTELPGSQNGDRLYFKILDTFYPDNDGGYLVRIKEGTRGKELGPLESISKAFIEPVKIVMQRLYTGIITNSSFISIVRALLALYIVFYGFTWIIGIGGQGEIRKDAVIRVIKLGIVFQMLSQGSWDFFYNNAFALFVDGSIQVANLFSSPWGDYDPAQPWYGMDQVLYKFFSGETQNKIWGLLFADKLGFIYIPALYLAIFVVLYMLARALTIYLVAFVGIAFLVALAPFFIIFMLFQVTKELMGEWFNHLMGFFIQIVLLMACIGLLTFTIVSFMQQTIGYRVCWGTVWKPNIAGLDIIPGLNLEFWKPEISQQMSNVWVDANNDGVREINEYAYRYTDIPYLQPGIDDSKIQDYLSEKDFIDMKDLIVLIGITYLAYHFFKFLPHFANSLKGSGGTTDLASIFGGDTSGGRSFGKGSGSLFDSSMGYLGGLYGGGKRVFGDVRSGIKGFGKGKSGGGGARRASIGGLGTNFASSGSAASDRRAERVAYSGEDFNNELNRRFESHKAAEFKSQDAAGVGKEFGGGLASAEYGAGFGSKELGRLATTQLVEEMRKSSYSNSPDFYRRMGEDLKNAGINDRIAAQRVAVELAASGPMNQDNYAFVVRAIAGGSPNIAVSNDIAIAIQRSVSSAIESMKESGDLNPSQAIASSSNLQSFLTANDAVARGGINPLPPAGGGDAPPPSGV